MIPFKLKQVMHNVEAFCVRGGVPPVRRIYEKVNFALTFRRQRFFIHPQLGLKLSERKNNVFNHVL